MEYHRVIPSPIGEILLTATENALCGLSFSPFPLPVDFADNAILREAAQQLEAYFAGRLKVFSLPLSLHVSPFQRKILQACAEIPYGTVCSYGTLAAWAGSPHASRAAGGALHTNPIGIIIPCHRVVGADGRLTGYGGGMWRKLWLLRHEGISLCDDETRCVSVPAAAIPEPAPRA